MTWTQEQIKKHKKAADLLCKIIKEAFDFISKHKTITECDVQQFILKRFKHYGLRTDRDYPIVAFRENTNYVHYFPSRKSKKIEPNSLILIDVWARLKEKKSPYADIAWMGYYGKSISKEIKKVFDIILKSRDACVDTIKKNLKKDILITGKEAHKEADRILIKHGFSSAHSTGHSLGFRSPHGKHAGLSEKKEGKGR